MPIEIERKFLVNPNTDDWKQGEPIEIFQGYLASSSTCILRIRVTQTQAFITIKEKSGNVSNFSRQEFEYTIPREDGVKLLKLSTTPILRKFRYSFPFAGVNWIVDQFKGANKGLVLAEAELLYESQQVTTPHWVTKEVTNDQKYSSADLAQHPFNTW